MKEQLKLWLTQLGEQLGIGASSHLVEWGDPLRQNFFRALVDFGLGQDRLEDGTDIQFLPDLPPGVKLNVIVVTHHHLDHIGAIPALMSRYPDVPVLVSETAWRLMRGVLHPDGLKIQQSERRKARKRIDYDAPPAVFEERDVDELERRVVIVPDEGGYVTLESAIGEVELDFEPAGHLKGAMSVTIRPLGRDIYETPPPVFFTGDMALHDQPTVKGFQLPDGWDDPEAPVGIGAALRDPRCIWVTECTNGNGDRQIANPVTERQRLVEHVQHVLDRGARVLIPTFSLGRSPNVAVTLTNAGIPVALDGMSADCFLEEVDGVRVRELVDSGMVVIPEKGGPGMEQRFALAEHDNEPVRVIITGSGTADRGWANFYNQRMLGDSLNAIVFVGHIFENTVAEELVNGATHVTLVDHKEREHRVEVKAEVNHLDLTSHVSWDVENGMPALIRQVSPAQVVLHHGENGGIVGARERIIAAYGCEPAPVAPPPGLANAPQIHWARHGERLRLA